MDLSEIEFGEIECGRNLNQALEDKGRLVREAERAVSQNLLRALKELYDAAGLYSTRHPDHVAAMNGAAKALRDAALLAAEGKVQP